MKILMNFLVSFFVFISFSAKASFIEHIDDLYTKLTLPAVWYSETHKFKDIGVSFNPCYPLYYNVGYLDGDKAFKHVWIPDPVQAEMQWLYKKDGNDAYFISGHKNWLAKLLTFGNSSSLNRLNVAYRLGRVSNKFHFFTYTSDPDELAKIPVYTKLPDFIKAGRSEYLFPTTGMPSHFANDFISSSGTSLFAFDLDAPSALLYGIMYVINIPGRTFSEMAAEIKIDYDYHGLCKAANVFLFVIPAITVEFVCCTFGTIANVAISFLCHPFDSICSILGFFYFLIYGLIASLWHLLVSSLAFVGL